MVSVTVRAVRAGIKGIVVTLPIEVVVAEGLEVGSIVELVVTNTGKKMEVRKNKKKGVLDAEA